MDLAPAESLADGFKEGGEHVARRRKRRLALIASALGLAALGYGLFWLRRSSAPQVMGEVVRRVETSRKVIALTFDDGPNPEATGDILALLERHNAKATFFVVDKQAAAYPHLVRDIYRGGHELGNHSWDHARLVYRGLELVRRQIQDTDRLIRALGYTGEIHFRAPYGHKLFVLSYILRQTGRRHVLWSIELADWDSPPPERALAQFDRVVAPGKILLLHDGYVGEPASRRATVQIVAMILEKYSKQGYSFVTISELLRAAGRAADELKRTPELGSALSEVAQESDSLSRTRCSAGSIAASSSTTPTWPASWASRVPASASS